MDTLNLSDFKPALSFLMERESKARLSQHPRYWYPLSLPTYGSAEIMEALDAMCSFRTSMAEKTPRFEKKFAAYQGCEDAIMVNSGSSADLLLGLLLTNPLLPLQKPGSEVIVPVVTWPTQVWSIMMAGLKVRFVDVNPDTLNVDLEDLEAIVSDKTRVLFLVHLMGNPCNMSRIQDLARKRDLQIIEDCCEAMGATWNGIKVGNFGLGASFSFFFSHHITTMEGGMIAVSSAAAGEQLRILRAHGWTRNIDSVTYDPRQYPAIDSRYAFVNWGLNVRPTELQAAFGLHQIELAEAFAARRECLARGWNEYLTSRTSFLSMPKVERGASPSWLGIPLMVSCDAPFSRKAITSYLEGAGVETRPIVAGNLARHPAARRFAEFQERNFPGADEVHNRGFYIGLSPVQTDDAMNRLMEVFDEFLSGY